IREVVNLNYEAVCTNLDGNDVYMTFTLEEEKNKFYIKDAVMDSAVHVVFRQDAPELTKSFVNKVENMIGDDFYKLDGDEKQDRLFHTHPVARAIMELFDGNAEDLAEYIDPTSFTTESAATSSKSEVIKVLKDALPHVYGQFNLNEITIGSMYDNLET